MFSILFISLNFLSCSKELILSLVFFNLVVFLSLKYMFSSKHVLILLLTLEVMMLVSMLMMTSLLAPLSSSTPLILIFFTLAVCEASLGLGVLIQLTRKSGNDSLMF